MLEPVDRWSQRVTVPASGGMKLKALVSQVMQQFLDDHVRAFAGNLAFRGLFAVFASIIVVFFLLAFFEARHLVDTMMSRLSGALPEPVRESLKDQILASTREQTDGAIGVGTLISIAAALYGLSAAARGVIDAMNVIYRVEEKRPVVRRFLTSIVMAVVVIALLLVALILVVLGPELGTAIASSFGLEEVFETTWSVARWPLLASFVLLAYTLVYHFAPATKIHFRWFTHGSIVAFFLWLGFTALFRAYVNNFGSFNATYGALSGTVVLLLYMYVSSLILLLGAEINDVIHKQTQKTSRPDLPAP